LHLPFHPLRNKLLTHLKHVYGHPQVFFGDAQKIEQLFPPAEYADPSLNFYDYSDVIKHYTGNSLRADGVTGITHIEVTNTDGKYYISLTSSGSKIELETFGRRHAKVFSKNYAQKAIKGMELLKNWVYGIPWRTTE